MTSKLTLNNLGNKMAGFTVTSDIDNSTIILAYTDGKSKFLSFEPERQELINMSDGKYDFPTANGCCTLFWSDAAFGFILSKYGDNNGGTLDFIVLATPELKASFNRAVIKWNEAVCLIKVREMTSKL